MKRLCAICGKEFEAKQYNAKICRDVECQRTHKSNLNKRRNKSNTDIVMTANCQICGKSFVVNKDGAGVLYCSEKCRKIVQQKRDAKRNQKQRLASNYKKCPVCGKGFQVHVNGALVKYCSQDCFDEARRIRNREHMRKVNPPKPDIVKECEWCGQTYTVLARNAHIARFCSNKCAQTQYSREIRGYGSLEDRRIIWEKQKAETRKHKTKERAERRKANHRTIVCSECGKTADVYNPHQKTCSPECSKARTKRMARERKDKRLNNANVVDRDISLKTLYKRDKGICYICGGKCDFKDHERDGSNFISGPTYPSIDHIIPLARGGKHAWDNVKLAHHLCNAKKSDILPSELELNMEINDAYALARKVSPRKKQVRQFTRDGKLIAVYESTAEAERMTGFKQRGIQDCARGEAKSHRGYVWLY